VYSDNIKIVHLMFASLNSNTAGVINGAGTAALPEHLQSPSVLVELMLLDF